MKNSIQSIKLVNIAPETNTNKFWSVTVIGRCAVCAWGRIGSWQQEKAFNFGSQSAAIAFAEKKAFSKLGRGYSIQSGRI